jgi:hypothetical protein
VDLRPQTRDPSRISFRVSLPFVTFLVACSSASTTDPGPATDAAIVDAVAAQPDATAAVTPDAGSVDATLQDAEPADAAPTDGGSRCAYPLVELQTARDPQCSGGNRHLWPIGMAATECHGWRATDPTGRQHDNSANAIGCNPDGSFTYTQFAGNLDCNGTGVTKTFMTGVCQQDIPPVLYTLGVNLDCCTNPTSPSCVTGVPSVTVPGGEIFLNSTPCP